MQLFKSTEQEFVGLSNNERTVFPDLQAGNYSLLVETIKQPIKIRLK
jgi:hypothetical protein